MKWVTLLKDIKEKVGFAQSPTSTASSSSPSSAGHYDPTVPPLRREFSPSPARDKYELEVDFKRFWEEFRSSSSEKEKEETLNLTVDAFCRLVKQQSNVSQLVTMLVETHIFSFVVGRAFVTDIEKLKISSKTRTLDVQHVLLFFSEVTQDGLCPGANLLTAVEILVSGPIDKQSLLDSGIFCCLIHILNALLIPYEAEPEKVITSEGPSLIEQNHDKDLTRVRRLEVEGSVVHIMKALSSHPSAALSLIEDNSLQLLFQMVANGSTTILSNFRDGLVLHRLQLHRHAMQILGLLLVNDNGSTARYIHRHHLIKVLLMAIKDFNPGSGDSSYTMGIVDLLLECVELSYRPEAGGVSLRDDIRNAHGYPFLVQFALILSSMQRSTGIQSIHIKLPDKENDPDDSCAPSFTEGPDMAITENSSDHHLSPALSRLLDVLVNLAQIGPGKMATTSGGRGSKSSNIKTTGHNMSRTSSIDQNADDLWEKENNKVKDLEAIQVLLEIFLKAGNRGLQEEVLNRMFKIFSSHIENYKICQELRTVPLFIQNMAEFPPSFQEIILKILEYAVTVVNCVPEQELLSLSCLLQQPITSDLKQTILSFFVKLLSFDQQYKKVLREVGVLAVLLDDLKQHMFLQGSEQHNGNHNQLERTISSSSFNNHLDGKDVIISSPRILESGSVKFPIFEVEATIDLAWDCFVSLLKKTESNQAAFRAADGVPTILPFLASSTHRQGTLRILSCLIIEDITQVHPDELSAIVEVLKSGMVTSVSGSQYRLESDAKCDTMGTLWRILGANNSAQRVFGEATGFSLLLTVLHDFQNEEGATDKSFVKIYMKVFTYLLRLVTAGVCDNAVNRIKLHPIISSQTFFELLCESGLLSVDFEKQIVQLLLELALEIVLPPFFTAVNSLPSDSNGNKQDSFLLVTPSASCNLDKRRVYNAGAVMVLIRSLLLFTPKMQLEVLNLIEKLVRASSFNQENLTSVGCVELLLEMIHPFIGGSSPLLSYALKIVEVLGSYRLSASELRVIVRYIFQMRLAESGHILVDMMERLILLEDMASEHVSLAPFVEMDMRKVGHSSIQVSLGERSWPPAAGYSFVCWFQFQNFLKPLANETGEHSKAGLFKRRSGSPQNESNIFRIFSVGSANSENTFYAELYLQDDGTLTLSTSNSSSLSFSSLELEEGRWHHLAVVHSKPNALAGLFQASFACVYINGKLRHTGKLGYSPSPAGKPLQVTIGTPSTLSRVSDLTWKLRSCYLFEEVLTPGCVCFMYILGRGYRGLFQDTDLLRFVPNQACGGGSMAILDSLDTDLPLASSTQRLDSGGKQVDSKADCSGMVWDLDWLGNLSLQLSGKKLIFAFDGTCTESVRTSGSMSLLNLVDPMSAAASPIGGIPRFGRLHGDIFICGKCVIGDTIRPIGGIAVILALIEAAETRDMLHMAITLLASALLQNPHNLTDMQACRGYHLLALFLRRRMTLFEMQTLEIFFQIAACEASFSHPRRLEHARTSMSPGAIVQETNSNFEDLNLSKFRDEISSFGSHGDMDDFSMQKDSFSHISELENAEMPAENANCIVLCNPDMFEHVLLDWTLWVTAPVSHQIALLVFLEHLVSMHWYRNHNLAILRRMNLVQHLLVTLQRGDVEVPVLEKLVVLLGVILEDGFLSSELEHVVTFVIMTFDPPELTADRQIVRETMGKHVIVRNMLLEMLIDLQVTIKAEELLEQWHKVVSSKLITYFLDEAVHPTSMRWIMTLLGICLASSPTFALKFRISGGYQGLARVLQSFYDSPDIYYILFCLMFGKLVYPRLPEVRMLDFHALIPSDGSYTELKFVDLLESVISMAKAAFDRLSMQLMLAHQTGNFTQVGAGLIAELFEGNADIAGDLQGEALMHKTYAARLMGGEASAPMAATSVLRFMVDLAKMCPPFSAVCRRSEFLESCVDLYFSCVRAACTVKMARELSLKIEEKNLNDTDDNSSQNTFSSLPQENEQSAKTSISIRSFPPVQISSSSEDIHVASTYISEDNSGSKLSSDSQKDKSKHEDEPAVQTYDHENVDPATPTSSMNDSGVHSVKNDQLQIQPPDNQSMALQTLLGSPSLSEKSNSKIQLTPSSPVAALTSWLGSASHNESKTPPVTTTSLESSSFSASEYDPSSDFKLGSQGSTPTNTIFSISTKVLLEIDDSGYGGGPCSAGATAILDFTAEVLSDFMTEQIKGAQIVENIVENVPLYVDSESILVFQGLCLSRLMIFLERRLIRDDEEDDKKLDKARWSSNLDALCWMIVDRVYMGAFPQPASILKTLEFLLSMLQLANKDGRIEQAVPTGKGLLSYTRGSKQLEAYIQSILKNTNRLIMYCFLPSFLVSLGEDDLLSRLGMLVESKRRSLLSSLEEDSGINISTVLQLLVAHKQIIFCPSNVDTDLNCCLCINLISLLHDQRRNVQNMAVDIIKYLLIHRRVSLEDMLVSKPNQGQHVDVLHGGFDKLLTGTISAFFEWFHSSEPSVSKVLEQCAAIMWAQYIAGSAKFPGVRIKGMEGRRKKEMGRRNRETSKLDVRHLEQINERRYALELVRDQMSTELRVVRQDKYGWILHAESEWQNHLQQLVHERGILPVRKTSNGKDPEWQLCPIEGPYRMRKKLERCKLRIDSIQNVLNGEFELEEAEVVKSKNESGPSPSDSDSELFFHQLMDSEKPEDFSGEVYEDSLKEVTEVAKDSGYTRSAWNDASSMNESSLHSALEFGGKSSAVSIPVTESNHGRSELGSPRQSSIKVDDAKVSEDKSEKELNDSGEYLIRPYLEPLEKIRYKYNCERVIGLDKHDGIFLIGELCLYVIENFYIDESGCICEKECQDELSVIDQALGVKKDVTGSMEFQSKSTSSWSTVTKLVGGRAWAYNGGAWGKERVCSSGNLPHNWRMWKLNSVHEILKRDYQLRPVAIEIFSMEGNNDLLVFHKREREEVFRNLVALNLPRNSMLDTTISGSAKQETGEGGRLFKLTAKSFSKRWQNGEISNFQYLMHLNTLAGRGYSDLTQYPVFPWVLADYDSENLDFSDPKTFRNLNKPMGCQTPEGEDEFRKRYESWDDPEVPKFHYGSHYSSAGIVLFYLLRLPPFSAENQKLQGGQFDHADRLFNSVRDTWLSAAGRGNTSDVKELIPEFFYMPEFLENRFNLDLGVKQSGEKVTDVVLPPWAKGSAREFIKKHREALESDYVSENLHHWIDLIFGYKQRGKAAEEAVNVFYHYTYEGSVDIDLVTDPAMKASILAQINHFGQTPKQLFQKPHVKRKIDRKLPPHPLKNSAHLIPREVRKVTSSVSQIVTFHDKILVAGGNTLLKPKTYTKYVSWGFPDRSLRFMSYDQDRLLWTHENLHGGNQIQCVSASLDGQILVTGADDGLACVWRIGKEGSRTTQQLALEKSLSAHTGMVTCLYLSQPYMLIVSGSDDCTVILWDLSTLSFVRQLPEFPSPISAINVNDLTGEILTAAGILLAVWSINGDCLAAVNTSQLPSDYILSVTSSTFSDWQDTNWYVTGHQSGAVKVWQMVHCSDIEAELKDKSSSSYKEGVVTLGDKVPEYRLVLRRVLKSHKYPVTALFMTSDLKQLLSGDSGGHLLSWTIPDESTRGSFNWG
ncbi:hypothetical protein SAY86_005497 [Trapa natans]|uniref:Uncharacterized protein n=1 Tax=Trapa natans TaxID=22666 RepID=A0AAN7QRH2_TRANT|nr:hypothetical protein SAY86_005497 [Trapa natans]